MQDHFPPVRKGLRLSGYDYRTASAYFVTICAQDRACVFGEINDQAHLLYASGNMLEAEWQALSNRFPGWMPADLIVMPNHVHGILLRLDPGVVPQVAAITTLSGVVGAYKSLTTNAYIKGVKETGWPRFNRQLWQRNYFEHIIRGVEEFERIQQYIADNPRKWMEDPENPDRV